MIRRRVASIFIFFSIVYLPASGTIHNVPADYSSIQTAINASSNGDTIIVARGTYYENINFRGKRIILASSHLLTGDPADIDSTIINGSNPALPDTASCVLVVSGEDTTTVLDGFTLTGGTGTVWRDIHNHSLYREGGGILIELSSPIIRNNVIVKNQAVNIAGVTSAGGGGIRIGDGNPRIFNNVIADNSGRYGGGIVLNYTGALIRNNVIYRNTGGEDFGGSGVWSYANGPAAKILENNTIIDNVDALNVGGILVQNTSMYIRNCIVWGNIAPGGAQILRQSGVAAVTYCDVQGGWGGGTNINLNPLLSDTSFYLHPNSPCIDAGDPSIAYNDPEDIMNPGFARLPAMGLLHNDIGAYGGPRSKYDVYIDGQYNNPLPPSGFTAYGDYVTPTSIQLRWQDPQFNRRGEALTNFALHIYRDGSFIASVDSGIQSFSDTGLTKHQQYIYFIRTSKGVDSSSVDSASAYAGGHAQPQSPAIFNVSDREDGIVLTWKNPSRQLDSTPLNDFAEIIIYRDSVPVYRMPQIATDTALSRSFADTATGYHNYYIQAGDNELPKNYSASSPVMLGYGGNILSQFVETFESDNIAVYKNGSWDTTGAISHSGLRSFTDSPGANYLPNTEKYFLTPPTVIGPYSFLRFSHIAILDGVWDRTSVAISTDKRISYKVLKTFRRSDYAGWQDGVANPEDWVTETFDLAAYTGDTVVVRFLIYTDNTGTADGWYVDDITLGSLVATNICSIAHGWNMLSLPNAVVNGKRNSLFPSSISRLFTFNGSGYIMSDSLNLFEGYWLKFDSSQAIGVDGDLISHATIDLHANWNMVGGISYAVDTSSVVSTPPQIIKSPFYTYDGAGYVASPKIEPGYAYWVRSSQAGKLTLQYSGAFTAKRTTHGTTDEIDKLNTLTFSDNEGNRQELFVSDGGDVPSAAGRYELPPLPPPDAFDVRFGHQSKLAMINASGISAFPIQIQSTRYPLILSWKKSDDAIQCALIVDGQETDIRNAGSLRLDYQPKYLAVKGTRTTTKMPITFRIEQNHPNPFNPTTDIRFSIPVECFVTIKIYDVIGQEVAKLVEETKPPGEHTVRWSASASGGMPSGIYFYRIQAGSFIATRKMILIR